MDKVLYFIIHYYYLFIGFSVFLVFSLIGCLVNEKQDERFLQKNEIDKELESRMNVAAATNMTIGQMVQTQNIVNPDANVTPVAPVAAPATPAPEQTNKTAKDSSK